MHIECREHARYIQDSKKREDEKGLRKWVKREEGLSKMIVTWERDGEKKEEILKSIIADENYEKEWIYIQHTVLNMQFTMQTFLRWMYEEWLFSHLLMNQ